MRHLERSYWGLVLLLFGIAAFGIWGAKADPLWFDEFWSIFNAGGATYEGLPQVPPLNPLEIWRRIAIYDALQAPGHALLLSLWARLVGWTDFATRMLSVLLGLLAVATSVQVGAALRSRQTGVFAAWILGTSAFFAHYIHELRMYTLLVLLVNAALWAYWRLNHRQGGWFAAGVWIISLTGLVYTQYLAGLVLVGIGIYHLWGAPKTRRWWLSLGGVGVGILLYSPWMPVLWGMVQSVSGGAARSGVMSTPQILWNGLAIFSNSLLIEAWHVALSFAPLWIALIGLAGISRWRGRGLLLTALSVSAALMLAVNAFTGMFIHIRYLLVMLPLVALLLAAGIAHIAMRRTWAAWALVVLWIVSGWSQYVRFEDTYNRDNQWTLDWHGTRALLEAHTLNPTDRVLVQAAGTRSWWDYAQTATYYSGLLPDMLTVVPLRPYADATEYAALLNEQIDGRERLLYLYDSSQPADRERFYAALPPSYRVCAPQQTAGMMVLEIFAQACDA